MSKEAIRYLENSKEILRNAKKVKNEILDINMEKE